MQPLIPRRVSPDDGSHYFFGYYDVPAFSRDGKSHLCHRVQFRDRIPAADDVAELGLFDLETGAFRVFATTNAWNFQQGSMLQWVASPANAVAYNRVGDGGHYQGVIHHLGDDSRRAFDYPFAAISADGAYALSINFDRMFNFRPGYGYASKADPWDKDLHPANDGVWLIDLTTGASTLILSLEEMAREVASLAPQMSGKLLVNHITFNTDGRRLSIFLRNFPDAKGHWRTAVLTADRRGGDRRVIIPATHASHYHWRDPGTLLMWAAGPQGVQLYEITDASPPEFSVVDAAFFLRDGHGSYSPDRRLILYDSYPDSAGLQHLYLYDLAAQRGVELGFYPAAPVASIDLRCDLHPRWRRDGRAISFDSTHEGFRALYTLDLEPGTG